MFRGRLTQWLISGLTATYVTLVFPGAGASMLAAVEITRPLWIISHRANDERDVAAAVAGGANGIEFDVVSEGDGSFRVRHPGSIDFHIPTLPTYLSTVFREREALAIAYVDYKGPDFSHAARTRLIDTLHTAGIANSGIHVLISTARLENRVLFEDFHGDEWIAAQFDESNAPEDVAATFDSVGIKRGWYGDGITNLLPEPPRVRSNIQRAIRLRDSGSSPLRGVVVWTLDAKESMRDYLRLGVDAILTNRPTDAVAVASESEFVARVRLASRADQPW